MPTRASSPGRAPSLSGHARVLALHARPQRGRRPEDFGRAPGGRVARRGARGRRAEPRGPARGSPVIGPRARGKARRRTKGGPRPRARPGASPSVCKKENAPCWPAASCSPTDYTAVPSALGGLTSGFGTGPGVPPLPWPPANKGRSLIRSAPPPCPQGRTALESDPPQVRRPRACPPRAGEGGTSKSSDD